MTDSLTPLAPLPAAFYMDRRLGPFVETPVAKWGDTLLVGFAPTALRLVDTHGTLLDTIIVPVRRRRGWSMDALRGGMSGPAAVSAESTPINFARLPTGEVALVYYDYRQIGPKELTASLFVTLLSPDLRRACVDAPVAVSSELLPVSQIRGDTLFVLQQHLVAGKPETSISTFRISDAGCDWSLVG